MNETAARSAADIGETSAREAADAALGSRIDNIVAPSGEAPSAAEVIDAREGNDGIIYPSLGTAIRSQTSNIKNALLADSYNFTYCRKFASNGAVLFDKKYGISDFVEVTGGNTLCLKSGTLGSNYATVYAIAYNSNKEFIEAIGITNEYGFRNYQVTSATRYIRLTFALGHEAIVGDNTSNSVLWQLTETGGLPQILKESESANDYVENELIGETNYVRYKNLQWPSGMMVEKDSTCVTEKINVIAGHRLYCYAGHIEGVTLQVIFYTTSNNRIDNYGIPSDGMRAITVPQNSAYMLMSFEKGYDALVFDRTSETTLWEIVLDDELNQKIKGAKNFELNKYLTSNGQSFHRDLCVSEKISIVKGSKIKVDAGAFSDFYIFAHEYSASDTMLNYWAMETNGTRTFTLNSQTAYIKISFVKGYSASVSLADSEEVIWRAGYTDSAEYQAQIKKDKLNFEVKKYPRSYYFEDEYINNKVSVIQNLMKGCMATGDAFFFITDEHWYANQKQSPSLIRYIHDKIGVDKLLDGGDRWDGYRFCVTTDFIDALGSKNVYPVVGNHEFLNNGTKDEAYTQAFYHLGYDVVWGEKGKLYYYVDNAIKKIRYIMIQGWDEHAQGSTAATLVISEEQLNWVENVALNVETGWTIVIVNHVFAMSNDDYDERTIYLPSYPSQPRSYEQLLNILDNYNGNGTIACVLQGHFHWDAHIYTNSGIPVIVTTCDKNAPWISGGVDMEPWLTENRIAGTITEQAFEVCVLDTTHRKITLVRIGAPIDDAELDASASREIREFTY